jgi:hypothetical protein
LGLAFAAREGLQNWPGKSAQVEADIGKKEKEEFRQSL